MSDITDMPYALWLEESLKQIIAGDPVSLCLISVNRDGSVLTSYYQCDATDKAVMAHNIQSDIVADIIRNNPQLIHEALEED